jgi:serine/threonine protein phosphatase PrpC
MLVISFFSEAGGHAVNEDVFDVRRHPDDPECLVCCLADGQGGQRGGAAAAQIACRSVIELAFKNSARQLARPSTWSSILAGADASVAAAPEAGYSTLIGFSLLNGFVIGASNGDSSLVVQSNGSHYEITKSQEKNPPVGSGCVGIVPFSLGLVAPWKVLAMSDGVWKYIHRELLETIIADKQGQQLIDALQHQARARGGGVFQDDFTVVAIERDSEDE